MKTGGTLPEDIVGGSLERVSIRDHNGVDTET